MTLIQRTWFTFLCDVQQRPTRSGVQMGADGVPSTKLTLEAAKCNLDVRKHFFSNRVVEKWNALPETLKSADSVDAFKRGYDELFGV